MRSLTVALFLCALGACANNDALVTADASDPPTGNPPTGAGSDAAAMAPSGPPDGPARAPMDATPPFGAPPDGGIMIPNTPSPGRVDCNNAGGCAAGQSCCIGTTGGTAGTLMCAPAGQSCAISLSCDERADCTGETYCCFSFSQTGGGASCKAVSACAGQTSMLICKNDGDCPAERPKCCEGALGGMGMGMGMGMGGFRSCRPGC